MASRKGGDEWGVHDGSPQKPRRRRKKEPQEQPQQLVKQLQFGLALGTFVGIAMGSANAVMLMRKLQVPAGKRASFAFSFIFPKAVACAGYVVSCAPLIGFHGFLLIFVLEWCLSLVCVVM
jgi:hypothetical protein